MDKRTELSQILGRLSESQWKHFLNAAADLFSEGEMEKAVEHGTVGEVGALYQITGAFANQAERAGLPETAAAYKQAQTTILQTVDRLDRCSA